MMISNGYQAVRRSLVSPMSLCRTGSLPFLVAQVQLQDLQTLNDAWEGQGRQDSPPADGEFAIPVQETLLASDMQVMRPRGLAQSLQRAGDLCGKALNAVMEKAMRTMRDAEF